MAEFLTTHTTASNIENIILNSKQKIVLVSPYLQLPKILFERLKDADERGVKIVLICGKDALKPDERSQLEKLKHLSLFFCENLHAKCYFNEDCMVITSMNLYAFSEKNNREMGVLIKRQDDADVFKEAEREVQSIKKASVSVSMIWTDLDGDGVLDAGELGINWTAATAVEGDKKPTPTPKAKKPSLKNAPMDTRSTKLSDKKLYAYCIRCGYGIPFDPYRPLCDNCYGKWADYGDPEYPERYCHSCGKRTKTTKDKPLCHSCFAKQT